MREAGPTSSWQAPCTVNEACKPSPSAKLPTTVPGPPALTGSIGSASDKVEVVQPGGNKREDCQVSEVSPMSRRDSSEGALVDRLLGLLLYNLYMHQQ